MAHLFTGSLCGSICRDCTEMLPDVELALYRIDGGDAVAKPGDATRFLDADDLERRSNLLLTTLRTREDGTFELDDVPDSLLGDGDVEIVASCTTVPNLPESDDERRRRPERVTFTVATVRPDWEQQGDDRVWTWHHCIHARFWCAVRARYGGWTICGRVTDCETGVGIAGARVTAFDTDWFQHDELGHDVTDGHGHYRIDYLTTTFKQTPFPLIDIEWYGGPDLFFKVESGGNVLLDEDPSRGRQPDRENAGRCECIDLCVEGETPPFNTPWFTHIGNFNIQSKIDPATGLTTAAVLGKGGPGFGFRGALKLEGFCPKVSPVGAPDPMRYRFLYVHPDAPGVQVPITGPSLVAPVIVGARLIQWKRTSNSLEWTFQTVIVAGSGATPTVTPTPAGPGPWGPPPDHVVEPDGDGWIDVDPNSLDGGFFGPLIGFNTPGAVPGGTAVTSATGTSPGDEAGNPVLTPRNGAGVTIVFQAGTWDGASTTVTHSNQVDTVHVNNWSEVRLLDLVQFGSGSSYDPCTGLGDQLDVLYTVDHELLLPGWSLTIQNAKGTGPGQAFPPAPAGTTSRGHAGTHSQNMSGFESCSYRVTLTSQLALTDGENVDSANTTLVTFCR